MNLVEVLKARRAELRKEEDAISAAAQARGGLEDAERDRLRAIGPEIEQIDKDIKAEEGRQARQRSEAEAAAVGAVLEASGLDPERVAEQAPHPFESLGEQMQAVAYAAKNPARTPKGLLEINDWSNRMAAASGANELIGSDGGFAVQTDFRDLLLDQVHQTGILAREVDRWPIGANSNGIKVNQIDETSRVNGSRWGGVQAYWAAEAGTLTGSKPKMSQLELTLQKLIGLYYATDELLQDATALEAVATAAFTEEFGFKLDDAIVNGTGAGQPLGILNAAALVTVAKETGQSAATVIAENVEKMYSRMVSSYIGMANWYINQDVWPQIFQLAHVVGTGGVPMYIPAGGINSAPFGTLLGRPIMPLEQCATLGTVGDIIFAAPRAYVTIDKGGVRQASSIHVQFLTDETVFRWTLRTNGRPKRLAALTPFKGSNTISPFVALATRS